MRRTMRLASILLLLPLFGCSGSYDWRDEHQDVLKSVSGYSKTMVVEFEDGTTYKMDLLQFQDSDPWGVGQECVLQSRKSSAGCLSWRFRSPTFEPEPHAPAENDTSP